MHSINSVAFAAAFPFIFAGMWCGISLLISRISGWHQLAENFPCSGPSGKRFFMQSGKIGLASYSNCLTIYRSQEGMYLSVWLPFRLGHPPLFIPWAEFFNPTNRRFLWFEMTAVDVGTPRIARLQLSKKIFADTSVSA